VCYKKFKNDVYCCQVIIPSVLLLIWHPQYEILSAFIHYIAVTDKKLISFQRGCHGNPSVLDGVVSENSQIQTYYTSCTSNLCNTGDGKSSTSCNLLTSVAILLSLTTIAILNWKYLISFPTKQLTATCYT
jgi:hypothetical protein